MEKSVIKIECEVCENDIDSDNYEMDWKCDECSKVICHGCTRGNYPYLCNTCYDDKHTYLGRLNKLLKTGSSDFEYIHMEGDNILIELLRELGHDDIADAWEKLPKWYA